MLKYLVTIACLTCITSYHLKEGSDLENAVSNHSKPESKNKDFSDFMQPITKDVQNFDHSFILEKQNTEIRESLKAYLESGTYRYFLEQTNDDQKYSGQQFRGHKKSTISSLELMPLEYDVMIFDIDQKIVNQFKKRNTDHVIYHSFLYQTAL